MNIWIASAIFNIVDNSIKFLVLGIQACHRCFTNRKRSTDGYNIFYTITAAFKKFVLIRPIRKKCSVIVIRWKSCLNRFAAAFERCFKAMFNVWYVKISSMRLLIQKCEIVCCLFSVYNVIAHKLTFVPLSLILVFSVWNMLLFDLTMAGLCIDETLTKLSHFKDIINTFFGPFLRCITDSHLLVTMRCNLFAMLYSSLSLVFMNDAVYLVLVMMPLSSVQLVIFIWCLRVFW